jgi:hypothetical protein
LFTDPKIFDKIPDFLTGATDALEKDFGAGGLGGAAFFIIDVVDEALLC